MSHRNARLTVHGRRLIIERVAAGMPVAHVAKAMGISRQCAHKWLNRYATEGDAGLRDRSSRPCSMPTRTPAEVEARVLAARTEHRRGPDWIGPELGIPARTVSRILRRHQMPRLAACDPLTGEVIRATKTTAVRYERAVPGELVHMDVKKIGRIPDGGGWRAIGRAAGSTSRKRRNGVGYDYVHSMVDDHSRLAYSEILPEESVATTAAFFDRAVSHLAGHGISAISAISEVMTDHACNYTRSNALAAALAALGARHRRIKPHCPWQNGKVERFNRTLQIEWAYRQVFANNDERSAALGPWLEHYNCHRRHSALDGHPPISRLPSPT